MQIDRTGKPDRFQIHFSVLTQFPEVKFATKEASHLFPFSVSIGPEILPVSVCGVLHVRPQGERVPAHAVMLPDSHPQIQVFAEIEISHAAHSKPQASRVQTRIDSLQRKAALRERIEVCINKCSQNWAIHGIDINRENGPSLRQRRCYLTTRAT